MTPTLTKGGETPVVRAPRDIEVCRLGQALRRLHDILPLKERQDSLEKPLRDLHHAILRSFRDRGRALTREEIAAFLGGDEAAARAVAMLGSFDLVIRNELVLRDANTNQLVVFDAKGGEVVGAYPMTSEPTAHKVTIGAHTLYAVCAVDALAIAAMFSIETLIDSRCHVTGEPVSIHQRGKSIVEARPSDAVQVGVRWQRLVDCAAHVLCRQMVFLKDRATAFAWLQADPLSKEVFTLEEAIEFGDAFFRPLLED
jgi:mercuric reductase